MKYNSYRVYMPILCDHLSMLSVATYLATQKFLTSAYSWCPHESVLW